MKGELRFRIFIIILTTIASFMTAFMGSALNIALPIIGKEYSLGAVLLSWLATAYLITTAVLLIPAGKLSDIFGRAKFLKIGVTVFSAGTILCTLSVTGTTFLIFRLIQGVGAAMMFTTSTAILVSAFPANKRGKVIGINTTAVYIGLSSGPFFGGIITQYLGWKYIFYFSFLLGITVSVLLLVCLKSEWREAKDESFDFQGSIIYVVSMISVMLGMTFIPSVYGILLFLFGLIMLYYFYKFEKEKNHPLFNVKVFRHNRTFVFSNLAALINYSATFAIGFILSLYLQSVKGLSSQDAGFILMTQPVVMALFSTFAGRMSDKIEPQIVASVGMGLLTVCLIVFIFISPDFGNVFIVVNLAFIGLGFALFSSPNSNAVMSSVEKKYYGVASSTLSSMRMVGQMFSMGIVIVIISMFIGKAEITIENQEFFIGSVRIIFLIFSILCFIGIFASLSRGKIHGS
ncbi:MAG: MFS transporter [Ignavibacteria bacterium]|nr:MFS transporter [Ignavibacteria bacterium]